MKRTLNIFKCMLFLVAVSVLIVPSVTAITNGTVSHENKWGGIASSVNNLPPGTSINEILSSYYGKPIATGNNKVYWFIGGYGWFNQTEMLNLPSMSLMYDISPYDCQSYGCGGSSTTQSSTIPVPVSGFVIVGFIGVAAMLWKKYATH